MFGACIELTKPGITKLVTITALVGLLIGGLHYGTTGVTHWIVLIVGCLIGTSMASGGANALNMWYESDLDALMERTITNTLIGAVPGALPTMIGTAAVAPGTGFEPLLDPIGLMLFILMFVWQMPHFFAIAWMCRVDYEKGGFRMLPSVDESGNHTAAVMIGSSLLMIPVSLLPMKIIPELSGWVTGGTGIVLGSALVWLSIKFARSRTDKAARTVFFGSIIHLPVYMTVFVAEALIRTVL